MANKQRKLSGLVELSWPLRSLVGGFYGVLVLAIATLIKLVLAIPRFFTEAWTVNELWVLPIQVLAIGFAAGASVGLLLPLSRLGKIGDGIIGVVSGNCFMIACATIFGGNKAFAKIDAQLIIAVILASAIGAFLAIECGAAFRQSENDDKELVNSKEES